MAYDNQFDTAAKREALAEALETLKQFRIDPMTPPSRTQSTWATQSTHHSLPITLMNHIE